MGQEIKSLIASICIFTKIPPPRNIKFSRRDFENSLTFFPLIGWLVGATQAGLFYLVGTQLPQLVAIILALGWSMLLTGALQEDGLASFAEGYIGGHDQQSILRKMQHGQFGVVGMVSLLFTFGIQLVALDQLSVHDIALLLLIAPPLARIPPLIMVWRMQNEPLQSTAQMQEVYESVVKSSVSYPRRLVQISCCIPALLFFPPALSFLILAVLVVIALSFTQFLSRTLASFTMECLGALQQISQILIILIFCLVSYGS